MRHVKINRADLELAFEWSDYAVSAYLDRETGRVLYVEAHAAQQMDVILTDIETLDVALAAIQAMPNLSDEDRTQMLDAARVEWDAEGRYLPIPNQDSQEGYRDMEEFIETLTTDICASCSRSPSRAAARFVASKTCWLRYPDTEADWFRFRDVREHNRLLDWLASEDIEPEFE